MESRTFFGRKVCNVEEIDTSCEGIRGMEYGYRSVIVETEFKATLSTSCKLR